jgi:hypothetical protein
MVLGYAGPYSLVSYLYSSQKRVKGRLGIEDTAEDR